MVSNIFRNAGLAAICAALLYQTVLRDVFIKLGFGRSVQPISDFAYQCGRVSHPGLEACEDMWLDESSRQLYLACSSVASRRSWLPNVGKLNESAVSMEDAVYVLDIDRPSGKGYNVRKLASHSFHGIAGEGSLHLLSISGRRVPGTSKIELYLVNNKPSLSSVSGSGEALAANSQTGANSTIELFELEMGSSHMTHVRTFHHPLIATPNNVALRPDGSGIYISNDHGSAKTGWGYTLSPFIKSGNVVYCTNPPLASATQPDCKIAATGLSGPNGLTIHPMDSKTLYVPSTYFDPGVSMFKIHPDGQLSKVFDLTIPYPLDNLSPGSDGSIYAASFPKVLATLKSFEDPATYSYDIKIGDRKSPPAAVLKINKIKNLVNDGREVTWTWEKVVEDASGQVLPMTTVALEDTQTGRLFMNGILSHFIAVCEPS